MTLMERVTRRTKKTNAEDVVDASDVFFERENICNRTSVVFFHTHIIALLSSVSNWCDKKKRGHQTGVETVVYLFHLHKPCFCPAKRPINVDFIKKKKIIKTLTLPLGYLDRIIGNAHKWHWYVGMNVNVITEFEASHVTPFGIYSFVSFHPMRTDDFCAVRLGLIFRLGRVDALQSG